MAGRDIAAFVGLLLGGSPPCSTCAGDADGSGGIDLADVPPLIDCLLTGNCPTVSIALCTPGDLTDNGQVTTEDIPPFVQVLLTGTGSAKEPCAADLSADGMLDGRDIQPFVDCLLNPGTCPPPPDGALPTSTDNTFYLHGAIVDQLAPAPSTGTPRLLLQYNRARYYDLRHARWLQRDPTGYVDGANLYEALHVNPARFTDPDGRYTKLYSTWNEGDEVLWQRMGWFGSVQDEFSVGKYYYLRGEKIVLYRRDIEGRGVLRPVVQGRGELGHRMNSASTCCKRSGSATDRTSCP